MVTHDIDNAIKYSDKILHLHRNNKYYFGPKEDYLIHGGCTPDCCMDVKYGPADSECSDPSCKCHISFNGKELAKMTRNALKNSDGGMK